MSYTVAVVANSVHNLLHFRGGLVRALVGAGYRVVTLAPPDPASGELTRLGTTFVPLPALHRRSRNPVRELRLLRQLYRAYRRQRVDAALHFTIKPVVYGSLAARLAGARNLSTLTGLGYSFLNGRLPRLLAGGLYRLALRWADRVFFHNPDDRDLFVTHGVVTAARARVVGGSGVDLGRFAVAPFGETVPGRFLFVGRLLIDKGIREFVAAAQMARTQVPGLSFDVVGTPDPGNPATVGEGELRAWRQRGDVAFHGAQADVRPFLRRAAVVVLPSYREGCPRVLLEALATGRPVVGCDVPGSRQLALPERTGWRVPARDPVALAAALVAAARTPHDELAALGRNGRALVAARFSEERVVADYLAALQSLLP